MKQFGEFIQEATMTMAQRQLLDYTDWGFFSPKAKRIGPEPGTRYIQAPHEELAEHIGFDSADDALENGYIRFYVSKMSGRTAFTLLPKSIQTLLKVLKMHYFGGPITVEVTKKDHSVSKSLDFPNGHIAQLKLSGSLRESKDDMPTSDRASYWGFLGVDGKVILGKGVKDHFELARKVLGVSTPVDAIRHGQYIRFSVGRNGTAIFDLNPQPKTVQAVIAFISKKPDIVGKVAVDAIDRYKHRIGYWEFDRPDDAMKRLNRVATLGEDWFTYDYKRAEIEDPEGGEDIVLNPEIEPQDRHSIVPKSKQVQAPPQPTSDVQTGHPYDQEIDSQAKKTVTS